MGKVLIPILIFLSVISSIIVDCDAEEREWKIYHSDEVASHYYSLRETRSLGEGIVSIWVRILPNGSNKVLSRDALGGGCSEQIDFSDLKEIQSTVEVNCIHGTYRVLGGLFKRESWIMLCETSDGIKWSNVPLGSAIQKLSEAICR
jgi:hypothetical protein